MPNTGGLRGIVAAATAGIVAGNPENELELLARITEAEQAEIAEFIKSIPMTVTEADTKYVVNDDGYVVVKYRFGKPLVAILPFFCFITYRIAYLSLPTLRAYG